MDQRYSFMKYRFGRESGVYGEINLLLVEKLYNKNVYFIKKMFIL